MVIVYLTTPNEKVAKEIAYQRINTKLAACINIISNLKSIYF